MKQKHIVVEIKDDIAIVLSDEAHFLEVENNNYEIGQAIHMNKSNNRLSKKVVTLIASAAAMVLLFTGAWAYATPYSYVSLDVNPSIEFTLNRFDKVLSVKAVNDDGQTILQEIEVKDLKHTSIKSAINKTVDLISESGFFSEDGSGDVVITTSGKSKDKSDKLAKELEEEITEDMENVVVEAEGVGRERVEEARKLGVTPGKLNLVQKLQASAEDPDSIIVEEWIHKSVQEIIAATHANRDKAKEKFLANNDEDQKEKDDDLDTVDSSDTTDNSDTIVDNESDDNETDKDIENIKENLEIESDKAEEDIEKETEKGKEKALKDPDKAKEKREKETEKIKKNLEKEGEKAKEKTEKEVEKAKEKAEREAEKAERKSEKASD